MLELSDIAAKYGETEALHGVSLVVEEGKITTIIGANGAGKTTTLRCISGLVRAFRGSIKWNGRELVGSTTRDIVRAGITMVPEGRRVFAQMTVSENLDMGAYLRRDSSQIKTDRDFVLDLFPVLKKRLKQHAGTLSGGEQQMLAVARALMTSPSLLLMDEPSMGLAPLVVEDVFRVIGRIRDMGKTVLLVEQNAAAALRIADRGYVLELGSIVLSGSGSELLGNPKVEKAYLGM